MKRKKSIQVRVPGNIRRKMKGSRAYKKERDEPARTINK